MDPLFSAVAVIFVSVIVSGSVTFFIVSRYEVPKESIFAVALPAGLIQVLGGWLLGDGAGAVRLLLLGSGALAMLGGGAVLLWVMKKLEGTELERRTTPIFVVTKED